MCQCVPIPLPFDLMHGPCAPAIVSGGMCTYYLNYLHALGIDPLIRKNQLFLLHLITSYSSYFEGKKGISGNKTSFFLLMYLSSPLQPPLKLWTCKAAAPKASTATHKSSHKATSALPEYLSSSLPPHQQQGHDNEDNTMTMTLQQCNNSMATT